MGDYVKVVTDAPATYYGVIATKGTAATVDTVVTVLSATVGDTAPNQAAGGAFFPMAKLDPASNLTVPGTYRVEISNVFDKAENELAAPTF